MNRLTSIFSLLGLLITASIVASSQSNTIGLPVIFVHGFCDSADAFLSLEGKVKQSLQTAFPASYQHSEVYPDEYIAFYDGENVNFQLKGTKTANYEAQPPQSTRFFVVALDDPGKSAYESFDPYEVMGQAISVHGDELAHIIWEIKKITKAPRVIVIGHSMGGLVARSYIESVATSLRMKGPDPYYNDIATLVTIDTPHGGTDWSKDSLKLPWAGCAAQYSLDKDEMTPGSPFLSVLNYSNVNSAATELPPALDVYSVASVWDSQAVLKNPLAPLVTHNSDEVVSALHQDLRSNLNNPSQHSGSGLIALPNQFSDVFKQQDGKTICGFGDVLHLLRCTGFAPQTVKLIENAVDSGPLMANKTTIAAPAQIVAGTKVQLSAKSSKDPLIWSLLEGQDAGNIDSEKGMYTAPDIPGAYHAVAIDKVHFLQYGLATLNVITDPVKPTIADWIVSPAALTVGGKVTVSYSASDKGGSGLLRAELWRAPDSSGKPGTWTKQGEPISLSGYGPAIVKFADAPPAPGKYWYGTHLFVVSGNQTDEPKPVEVTITNPLPAITGLSPSSLPVGSSAQKLEINGTGFLPKSTATFNGKAHAIAFVSAKQLTISLASADLVKVSSYPVVVSNPAPGGGASKSVDFTVSASVSAISVSPSSVSVPSGAVQTFKATVPTGGTAAWGVREGAPGGSITADGVYTAPDSTGTFHIVATSSAHPAEKATATVTIVAPPSYSVFGELPWSFPAASLTQAKDGTFYGTTEHGAFKMNSSGAFTQLAGLFSVSSLIQASDGNLYGVDSGGNGSIFKMDASGNLTSIYSFSNEYSGTTMGGWLPWAGLIQGKDGYFYGTTYAGGNLSCDPYGWGVPAYGPFDYSPSAYDGCGTVFKTDSSGNVTILYSFSGKSDGNFPQAPLIQGMDGNFYGTTSGGGSDGFGTVFEMDSSGSLKVLHSFASADDGAPVAPVMQASDGNLYGTAACVYCSKSSGEVFKLGTTGSGFTVLHTFSGRDGTFPVAPLIQGSNGNFYGTTWAGGDLTCGTYYWDEDRAYPYPNAPGCGTVFKMDPVGNVTVLHEFEEPQSGDGDAPYAGVILGKDGYLYGTTYYGGPSIYFGTAFRLALPDSTQ